MKVLFFCRGRGRGHAVPDIEISKELLRLEPETDLIFASYSTGRATLAEAGFSVLDMGLSDSPKFMEVLVAATRLMVEQRPDLVISHEEFAVLPAAKSLALPVTFLVDFFIPNDLVVESLGYADEILFIERRGIFPEPASVCGKVRYVGPVVRPPAFARADRSRARRHLDIPDDATVISVIPGAWATEKRAPIFDLVVPAFDRLRCSEKRLLWTAGDDLPALSSRLGPRRNVFLLRECSPIEALMVASDVVVTKGNRGTSIDLTSLGIPSISLSWGLNPVDEILVARIPSNVALHPSGIDPDHLREILERSIAGERQTRPSPDYAPGGAAIAARELERIMRSQTTRHVSENSESRREVA